MERFERIERYEELFDSSKTAVGDIINAYDEYIRAIATYFDAKKKYTAALKQFEQAQPNMHSLEMYYTGDEWKSDYEADEAGELPKSMKRGVLSQDGINDLLDENNKILEMLKTIH